MTWSYRAGGPERHPHGPPVTVETGPAAVVSGVCDIADDVRAGDEVVPAAELGVTVDTGDCPVVAATSWREVHPVDATTQAANNGITIDRR